MQSKSINDESFISKSQKNQAGNSLIVDIAISQCVYQNIAIFMYFINDQE